MTDWKEFYKKNREERIGILKEHYSLSQEDVNLLEKTGALDFETANRMIENAVGTFPLPLGIATGFKINGKDYFIPFAVEEPSVIAGASNAAKLALPNGFTVSTDEPVMIGQIQVVNVKDAEAAISKINAAKKELLDFCNAQDATLVKFGGGARDIEVKRLNTARGEMLSIYLSVDVQDAMGANAVNTMCERVTPRIEELTGGSVRLRIISNLATKRLARAKTVWTKAALQESFKGKGDFSGEELIERILDCYAFAEADQYRATTHNKGIMNGVDAVVIATGNDWRAIESGAHSFACITGKYKPLTKYYKDSAGNLVGEIELPMAVGLIGGATKTHPLAQLSVKMLGVKTASELAGIIAAVGLAQNFAALRVLASEGIQRGHMGLHARNVAVMAGAKGSKIDEIAEKMKAEGKIALTRAQELLKEL